MCRLFFMHKFIFSLDLGLILSYFESTAEIAVF